MSERNGPGTDTGAANGQLAQQDTGDSEIRAYPTHEEGWFEPVPQAEGRDLAEAGDEADTGWFLRTGRAGLLPDSMTESWEESGHAPDRPETASAPPWAGEQAGPEPEEPPPWESGPWPEPGEARPARSRRPAVRATTSRAPGEAGNWQATAALTTGILPLVVPGAVFGVLGLRRAKAVGVGRIWSWLGIGCSAVWAVILIVVLTSAAGGSSPGCGNYQHSVSYPVAQVRNDLSSGAPQSVLAGDLRTALSEANAAAAATIEVSARNAMVALTGGLEQAQTQTKASHSTATYAAVSTQLEAEVAAVTAVCK